jgi:hypothetical protein
MVQPRTHNEQHTTSKQRTNGQDHLPLCNLQQLCRGLAVVPDVNEFSIHLGNLSGNGRNGCSNMPVDINVEGVERARRGICCLRWNRCR